MDWRAPSLDRHYNVILGADIVYERRMFSPLLGLMELALAPEARRCSPIRTARG